MGFPHFGEPRLKGPRVVALAGAALVLAGSILVLGSATGQAGPDERVRRNFCFLLFGAIGLVVGFLRARDAGQQSGLDRVITAAAAGLPCYALLQLIPLPVAVVSMLSPARAELLQALGTAAGGAPSFASLSVAPGITFIHFVLIAGYAMVFFSIRKLVASGTAPAWVFAAPVLFAAIIETAAGLIQAAAGAQPRGTFAVRNHYAGFLTMALPFALAWLLSVIHAARRRGILDAPIAAEFAGAVLLSAALLVGISLSLSRGGFVSALISVVVLAVLAFPSGMSVRRRLLACGAACLALFSGLFFLTPSAMVERLAEHTSSGRIAIWRNTLDLIGAYPLVGCGLGGYESAMLRFKTTVLMNDLDYAHNDYLQFLGELGLLGFLIAAVLFGSLLVRTIRRAGPGSRNRWLAVGCAGGFSAILAHSMFDFNLYVPANAITLASIAGISAGLSSRPRRPDIEDAEDPIEVLSTAPSRSMRSR